MSGRTPTPHCGDTESSSTLTCRRKTSSTTPAPSSIRAITSRGSARNTTSRFPHPSCEGLLGFSAAGLDLAHLRLGYQSVDLWPVTSSESTNPMAEDRRVTKMCLGPGENKSLIIRSPSVAARRSHSKRCELVEPEPRPSRHPRLTARSMADLRSSLVPLP